MSKKLILYQFKNNFSENTNLFVKNCIKYIILLHVLLLLINILINYYYN